MSHKPSSLHSTLFVPGRFLSLIDLYSFESSAPELLWFAELSRKQYS